MYRESLVRDIEQSGKVGGGGGGGRRRGGWRRGGGVQASAEGVDGVRFPYDVGQSIPVGGTGVPECSLSREVIAVAQAHSCPGSLLPRLIIAKAHSYLCSFLPTLILA